MVERNKWYSERCFYRPAKAWVLASDDGTRIRSRNIGAVSLCCIRPRNEIMPVAGGFGQQLKAYVNNQSFLRNPML
jgi:hypothetical protein